MSELIARKLSMNKTILAGSIVFVFFTKSNHYRKNFSLKDGQPKIKVTDCDHTKDGKKNTYDKSRASAIHPVLKLVLSRQPVLIGCGLEARLHNDCDEGDTNHMTDVYSMFTAAFVDALVLIKDANL